MGQTPGRVLAGSLAELWALPDPLQQRVQQVILDTFPAGHAAIVVSRLGIARVGTNTWLPELPVAPPA